LKEFLSKAYWEGSASALVASTGRTDDWGGEGKKISHHESD